MILKPLRRDALRGPPTPLGPEEICAVSRLRRRGGYLAAARNALIGRQRRAALDLPDEQIEGTLRVRLDQFELREHVLESLDMVSVLHLVQPVRWALLVVSTRWPRSWLSATAATLRA